MDLEQIEVLLFDVGGVLIELQGLPFKPEWVHPLATDGHVRELWLQSSVAKDFECGIVDMDAFAHRLIQEASLNTSRDELLEHFLYWPRQCFDKALDSVKGLSADYRLAALSNSNAYHWPRVIDELQLGQVIPEYYVSHELGMMKPDPAIFNTVVDKLGVSAEQVLFFDDTQANVDAAYQLGIKAVKVDGTQGIVPVLEELGLLSESAHRQTI